jgi:hypothetical protein
MPPARFSPFDLVFQDAAESTFPAIRQALESTHQDPRDRDAFLMIKELVTLLRDLRPDEGLGEGIDQLAALVHHAYLFWASGRQTIEVPVEQLPTLLGAELRVAATGEEHQPCYVQLPLRRIWASVVPGEAPEPLDGCFIHRADESALRVLGVFGVHPDRPGFSVVEVAGPRPVRLLRNDGTPVFSPTLSGGARAGLYSVAGEEELLELGWRVELGAGSWEPGLMAKQSAGIPDPERSPFSAPSS